MPTITKPFLGRQRDDDERDIGHEERAKVGRWIRHQREAKGLTQLDVGKALGVMNTYVSNVERGITTISPERYTEFADVLGVPKRDFGKRILRHYNPWLYTMLYTDGSVQDVLESSPERIRDLRE